MQTITVTNQKGGVGKTTTAHILATGLNRAGYRVLAVDIDPQTNFSYAAGVDSQNAQISIYSLFNDYQTGRGAIDPHRAIQKTPIGFDMLPGSLDLAGADMEYTKAGREYILKEILEKLNGEYDYCVIDTPPTLGILTVNALTASEKLIVPMGADVFSLQGLSQLQGMINNVKRYCNKTLEIDGLLLTKYNPRAVINQNLKKALENVADQLKTKVYKTAIRESVAIKEIQFLQADIFQTYPKHPITKDYQSFIDEFLRKEQ